MKYEARSAATEVAAQQLVHLQYESVADAEAANSASLVPLQPQLLPLVLCLPLI